MNISHAPNTAIFGKAAPPLWRRVQGLCSIDAYQLFQELTGPVKPASKIFAELVTRWTTIKTWKVIQWQIFFHFYPWNRRTDKCLCFYIWTSIIVAILCVWWGDFRWNGLWSFGMWYQPWKKAFSLSLLIESVMQQEVAAIKTENLY